MLGFIDFRGSGGNSLIYVTYIHVQDIPNRRSLNLDFKSHLQRRLVTQVLEND